MKTRLTKILSTFCLGALVGIILGLSISEVAGIVLGGLTSLLVTFLGLKMETDNEDPDSKIQVMSFSIGCLLFILIGITMRTHDVLSPSVAGYKNELQNLGLDSAEIQRIILLKHYGVEMQDGNIKDIHENSTGQAEDIKQAAEKPKPNHALDIHSTTLFSAAEDHAPQAHDVARHFSTYSLEQLKTYILKQGLPYEQFYNNVSEVNDTSKEKDILKQLIVICYDYKTQ